MSRFETQVTSSFFSVGSGLLELRYPDDLDQIAVLLHPWSAESPQGDIRARIIVRDVYVDSFAICCASDGEDEKIARANVTRDGLPQALFDVARNLAGDAILLASNAACSGEAAAIIVPEAEKDGEGFFSWIIARGFYDLLDPSRAVTRKNPIVADRSAFVLAPNQSALPEEGAGSVRAAFASASGSILLHPSSVTDDRSMTCGLIVLPMHEPGKPRAQIEPIEGSLAAFELMRRVKNVPFVRGGALPAISALARETPAVAIRYGELEQMEGVVDAFLKFVLDQRLTAEAVSRFLSGINRQSEDVPAVIEASAPVARVNYPIPDATAPRGPAKLTIGMATYDDYDGVYFSLQALRMYHPEVMDSVELLVIDNHPDGPCSKALKDLDGWLPNYRYIPEPHLNGTSQSRNRVFEEAAGEIVLCMDCHVFIQPGALQRLINYFDANPGTRDLIQGPMLADDLKHISTHFKPHWGAGMFGQWDRDPRGDNRDNEPFEIPMQGLGLFACRKEAWLGFHKDFRGFGGEEGYIHEKYRQHGARALCLPFLRWLHRFARPMGVPYPLPWEDRIRNYVIGRHDLGMPIDDVEAHFAELLGHDVVKRLIGGVQAELNARQGPSA